MCFSAGHCACSAGVNDCVKGQRRWSGITAKGVGVWVWVEGGCEKEQQEKRNDIGVYFMGCLFDFGDSESSECRRLSSDDARSDPLAP